MNRQLKMRILYAPLFTSMLLAGTSLAYSQGTSANYKNRIDELESRISSLEALKQELQTLKKNLKAKTKKVAVKEHKLDKALRSIRTISRRTAVRDAVPDSKWRLTGYTSASFQAVSSDTNSNSFAVGSFNPIFHYTFKNWIMFESELEMVTTDTGESAIEDEYAQINLMLNDSTTLVMGKFLSPIGQFQERLHPKWINKSVDRPAGLSMMGVSPATAMGVMLRGGIPLNKNNTLNYAIALSNGPRFETQSRLGLEGFGKDNNKNKAIGGRVSIINYPSSIEVGFSLMTSELTSPKIVNPDGSVILARKSDYRLWGADAAYTKGAWDFRFEIQRSRATPVFGLDMRERTWEAWYTQLAYRLSGVTVNPILGRFEPVARYGEYHAKIGGVLMDVSEKRWNIGLNYWLAPTIVVKAHLERRNYYVTSRPDETRYQLQFAYGF